MGLGQRAALSTLNIHSGLQLFLSKVSMMVNWNPKGKKQNGKKIDNWNPKLTIGIRNVWYKIGIQNAKCRKLTFGTQSAVN